MSDAESPDRYAVMAEEWRRERPDLDLSALTVLGRLVETSAVLARSVDRVLAEHGLRQAEFDVLAALRRTGAPYTLIPSRLAAARMMSRAGMTTLLDRLEQAGLVERRLDPADRRSFLVALTDDGRAVIDATLTDHAANLQRLVAGLTPDERATLDGLLRALVAGVA